MNKKLKKVHIGDQIWLCGVTNKNFLLDGKKTQHLVIYGPDGKNYHVYGNDVQFITTEADEYGYKQEGIDKHGNIAIESKLKIYILTNILDNRDNWEFDLTKVPEKGPLKIIYNNGTVKNIEFNGTFECIMIKKKYTFLPRRFYFVDRKIEPFGYRK